MLPSFFDELEKISAAAEEKDQGLTTVQRLAGSAAAMLAAHKMKGMARAGIGGKLMKSIRPSQAPISPEDIGQLQKSLSNVKGYDISDWKGSLAVQGSPKPGMMQGAKERLLGASGRLGAEDIKEVARKGGVLAPMTHSPEFLSHELGHMSLRDPKKSNFLLRGLMKARSIAPLAGLVGGAALATSDSDAALAAAPAVTALGYAPMLTDEALATRRGLKSIRGLGKYSPGTLRSMRGNLMKALGTYGALAAGTTLPIALISYLRSRQGDKGREDNAV